MATMTKDNGMDDIAQGTSTTVHKSGEWITKT